MNEQTPPNSTASAGVRPMRLLICGAGPLPEASSQAAPGVANRLWHFIQPVLKAGHEVCALGIEPDAPIIPPDGSKPQPRPRSQDYRLWHYLPVAAEDAKSPGRLRSVARDFNPDVVAGVGTVLAASLACDLADMLETERPVWVDFFGDPLAEVQMKAGVQGRDFSLDEHLQVWQLVIKSLQRADAFSTVSRRQADAMLGQLLVLGMTDAQVREFGADAPHTLHGLIHPISCGLESFDLLPVLTPEQRQAERRELLESLGLPAEARLLLHSGGFNAWVDPQTLAAGAEAAMEQAPELHLVVTGGELPGYLGEVYQSFEERAEASPHRERIHRLGWLPLEEAQCWLRHADLALMVDRPGAETRLGARNRLLYHAAARRATLASRGTEVVEEMEAAGALAAFDPGDAAAMAHAVLDLLADPARCERLGEAALDFCNRHYRFEVTARPFLDWIEAWREQNDAPSSPAGNSPPAATPLIADLLDMERRNAEWRELSEYRRGMLHRIWRKLAGR